MIDTSAIVPKPLLVTPSILGSIEWMRTAPMSWKKKAYDQLRDSLARVWNPPTMQIQRGIDFENDIYRRLGDNPDASSEGKVTQYFLDKCRGGDFQHKTKKYVTIGGQEYVLYGKLDVWFGKDHKPPIIDIKTTQNYKRGKYLATTQHLIYCYCTETSEFDYEIAEFKVVEGQDKPVVSTFTESYVAPPMEELEKILFARVKETIDYLRSFEELWDLFVNKFTR